MISKRIIGVITIKDNIAVQSFGYKKYLPLGDPKILVKNLDRWGTDEILINVIDSWKNDKNPNFEIISKIKDLNITTPIIYGGGINSLESAKKLIYNGVDRLLIEKIIINDLDEFERIYKEIGAQSLILSLPLRKLSKNEYVYFNSISQEEEILPKNFFKVIEKKFVSEILLIDYKNEGSIDGFNLNLLKCLNKFDLDIICFGGIRSAKFIKEISKNKNISAVAIGNSLNYQENSIQNLKTQLQKNQFRKPYFISHHEK